MTGRGSAGGNGGTTGGNNIGVVAGSAACGRRRLLKVASVDVPATSFAVGTAADCDLV